MSPHESLFEEDLDAKLNRAASRLGLSQRIVGSSDAAELLHMIAVIVDAISLRLEAKQ